MRPSLLPNLVTAAGPQPRSQARKRCPVRGRPALHRRACPASRWWPGRPALRWRRAAALGRARPRPVDAIDAKADALAALAALGIKPESVQVAAEAPAWYHPGRSGCLRQGRAVLATFGELHPARPAAVRLDGTGGRVRARPRCRAPAQGRAEQGAAGLEPLPYPPVDRDFAFVVDRRSGWQAVGRRARRRPRSSARRVCSTSISGPGLGGAQVAGHRRPAAGRRPDLDGGRDRGRRRAGSSRPRRRRPAPCCVAALGRRASSSDGCPGVPIARYGAPAGASYTAPSHRALSVPTLIERP